MYLCQERENRSKALTVYSADRLNIQARPLHVHTKHPEGLQALKYVYN